MNTAKVSDYRNFLDFGKGPQLGALAVRPLGSRNVIVRDVIAKPAHDIKLGIERIPGEWPLFMPIWVTSSTRETSRWIRRKSGNIEFQWVYSGGARAVVRPLESAGDYKILREKISDFQFLSVGWDSYGASAPSGIAVSATLKLVDELENAGILPEWVTPTSDSSILMRYRSGDIWFDWEFHSDGDVAVMRKPLFDKETYHDFRAGDVALFFSAQSAVR